MSLRNKFRLKSKTAEDEMLRGFSHSLRFRLKFTVFKFHGQIQDTQWRAAKKI